MAKGKPFTIGSVNYETKAAARKAVSALLVALPLGRVADEHFEYLLALLSTYHPEAEEKVGCGIANFSIRLSKQRNYPGFWLHRKDGSESDWSIKACFEPPSLRDQARAGMRREVQDNVVAFGDKVYGSKTVLPCALTGRNAYEDTSEIRCHDPTFAPFTDQFLATQGLNIDDVKVRPTVDGEESTLLADRELAGRWVGYHKANAKLYVVASAACRARG